MVIPETVTRTGPITQNKTEITYINNPYFINPTQIYTIPTNDLTTISHRRDKTLVIKVQTSKSTKDLALKYFIAVDRK